MKSKSLLKKNELLQRFKEGFNLHQMGLLERAKDSYLQVLKTDPKHFDAMHLLGVLEHQLGRSDQGFILITKAIQINPSDGAAYCNLGNVLCDLGRHEEAIDNLNKAIRLNTKFARAYSLKGIVLSKQGLNLLALESYDSAIAIQSHSPETYSNRGAALHALDRNQEAVENYDLAIRQKPNFVQAHTNRGNSLLKLGRKQEAIASYQKSIAIDPNYLDAYFSLGVAFGESGMENEAIECYEEVIKRKPQHAQAWNNRGNSLNALKQHEAAIESYDQALNYQPEYSEALNNRGVALNDLKLHQQAIDSFIQAISLNPKYVQAYSNLGVALNEAGQHQSSIESCNKAIELDPQYADAYSNRGNAQSKLRLHQDAVKSYDQAIAIKRDFAKAYSNRGVSLKHLKRAQEALASYESAIAINPNYANAHSNRGSLLMDQKRHAEAIHSFEQALAIEPEYEFLKGLVLHARMHNIEWTGLEAAKSEMVSRIEGGCKVTTCLPILALSDSMQHQRQVAEIWTTAKAAPNQMLGPLEKNTKKNKIRIAYFSCDFMNHAVAILTAGLFETHSRSAFEVYAFSFSAPSKDAMRQRLEAAFDVFIDVQAKSDEDIARLSRKLEIDIAVDLVGLTAEARTGIFALRCAPIQVSYLGYPGTMGASYIDYIIADKHLIPEDLKSNYSEKIAYLPCFQANDNKRKVADKVFTRKELGLPESGFVYCCFNNTYKFNPMIFDVWVRILKQVTGSVLFLYADTEAAAENLKKEAVKRGLEPSRLVFGKRIETQEYLARYRSADLFLDTYPFNGGATVSDALWAGLPVLTYSGESFASRMAVSLLHAVGLPELIASSEKNYEAMAVILAKQPERLNAIKASLTEKRMTSILFDTPLFTSYIEQAYTQMYERFRSDLTPDHIYVEQDGLPNLTADVKFKEGLTLHQNGQLAKAEQIYRNVLKLHPRHFETLHMIGLIAYQTQDLQNAAIYIEQALKINPSNSDAYSNLGVVFNEMGQNRKAVESYDKALVINPEFAQAHSNRGKALSELGQDQEAILSCNQAIEINPDYAMAYFNRGNALKNLKLFQPAIESYDKAIKINPKYGDSFYNRGNVFRELQKFEAAVNDFDKALILKPDYDFLHGVRLHLKMKICDWGDFEKQVSELKKKVEQKIKATTAFSLLALTDSPSLHLQASETWVNAAYPINQGLGTVEKRPKSQRIRIGYYSADFHDHATTYLMAGLFEQHDKSQFELIAFSFDQENSDEMRKRVVKAFDQFRDVTNLSDKEVASLSRQMGIDIAIDLKGLTQDCRAGIFSYRAAPIQVSYLGFPGTMGATYIDYLIADKTLIPKQSQKYYAEKIAYLPNSYQVNDSRREISARIFTREELKLPQSGFVYCCFNSSYKITPHAFDGWMRILKQVQGSVLWLIEDNPSAVSNLQLEAQRCGVDSKRLIFAKKIPLPDHLARHQVADLFLDTLPYNAHTTASDSLWAGVPVLTRAGESFASRVAASLLTALNLPELIASSQADYETLAVDLAINPERLKIIRQKLKQNLQSTSLFNTAMFARHIENAYTQMYERYHDNLPSEHIFVTDQFQPPSNTQNSK